MKKWSSYYLAAPVYVVLPYNLIGVVPEPGTRAAAFIAAFLTAPVPIYVNQK